MLARLATLAAARVAPHSPFEMAFGSMEAFADKVQGNVAAGRLDDTGIRSERGGNGIATGCQSMVQGQRGACPVSDMAGKPPSRHNARSAAAVAAQVWGWPRNPNPAQL